MIDAFHKGLKPALLTFIHDAYPRARTLEQACHQAADAAQIVYCPDSDRDTDSECDADMMVASGSSTDSEAVNYSDLVSDCDSVEVVSECDECAVPGSEESCVESDYVESQEESDEASDGEEEGVCEGCGEVCEVPVCIKEVKRRYKCYGCHGTGHQMAQCPMRDIKC